MCWQRRTGPRCESWGRPKSFFDLLEPSDDGKQESFLIAHVSDGIGGVDALQGGSLWFAAVFGDAVADLCWIIHDLSSYPPPLPLVESPGWQEIDGRFLNLK